MCFDRWEELNTSYVNGDEFVFGTPENYGREGTLRSQERNCKTMKKWWPKPVGDTQDREGEIQSKWSMLAFKPLAEVCACLLL